MTFYRCLVGSALSRPSSAVMWVPDTVCLDVSGVDAGVVIRGNAFVANRADETPGAAIRISDSIATVEFNVFERDSAMSAGSGGAGISWEAAFGSVQNNTFVGCHAALGAAFVSGSGGGGGFSRNVVAFSTGGVALEARDTAIAGNACNLYWENAGGNFGTWPASATAVHADPLFCNRMEGDVAVQVDSPCILAECGPIGALGVGCDMVSVEAWSWGAVKALFRTR